VDPHIAATVRQIPTIYKASVQKAQMKIVQLHMLHTMLLSVIQSPTIYKAIAHNTYVNTVVNLCKCCIPCCRKLHACMQML
jgi:hypothetical protein